MNRRHFLLATALSGLGLSRVDLALAQASDDAGGAPAAADAGVERFNFDRLIDRVSALAARDYEGARLDLQGDFANLSYDQYRDLRFRRERDPLLSSGTAFGIDLLSPGFLFTVPVKVSLVNDGIERELLFSLDDLDIGPLAPTPTNPEQLTWTGFRVRNPVNRPDVLDEVAVFQGASYFRAVARGLGYGLSARGLAIDTASERGEEFPAFRQFWVEVPDSDASTINVYALLDSPSVAGAYRFNIQPGAETVMQISSVLFPRRDLDNVGIAPLTSMFLFDASNQQRFNDYRPRVHDSDGVQMITGHGERIFRSLTNPTTLQVSSFVDENPIAFGLVQRHRDFEDFEDDEARYETRPSAWVQPSGDWGKGRVDLVEIPTNAEIHDNIAAFWRPQQVLKAGERNIFNYRLTWTDVPSDAIPLMRVRDVRIGQRPGSPVEHIVVDFDMPDGAPVDPIVSVSSTRGSIRQTVAHKLEANGNFRVSFDFDASDVTASDMRVQLRTDDGPVSETWIYRWTS